MAQRVIVGDQHYEFPDGMSDQEIASALKLDVTPAPATQPSPMSPVEGASPWASGEVPPPGEFARKAAPIVAGMAAGSIPGVGGLVAGPLAASVTDLMVNPTDQTTGQRETSFLTDVAAGLVPGALKGAMKLVPAPLESKITNAIRTGIEKAIRPTVAGKSTFGQTEQYFKRAQSAVETIVGNKNELKLTDEFGNSMPGLPKTLNQFAESIDQTKKKVFEKYNNIAAASETFGRDVDLAPVVAELKKFRGDKVNQLIGGTGNTRADQIIEAFNEQRLTPLEAQDMIAVINGRLKAFYRNPNPDQVSSAAVDALVANKLRKALDETMEVSGYKELKNQYGALSSIEKEVNQRAIVDARKNIKGLIDFSDIASAAEAARAIASAGSGNLFSAAAIKGMSSWYKYINNPNRIVGAMFGDVEKLMSKRAAYSTVPPSANLLQQ